MTGPKGAGLASVATDHEARKVVSTAKRDARPSKLASRKAQTISQPIRAELAWSDTATACGIVARSLTPVLSLCRQLVEAGHDPRLPLEAWRGGTLCLRVRSIGEAARLELNGHGNGFRRSNGGGTASPMRQTTKPVPNTPHINFGFASSPQAPPASNDTGPATSN